MLAFVFFLIYAAVIVALIWAHFFMAYRSWRISREEQSAEIDFGYVRTDSYFARSFRLKLADWLKLPVHSVMPDGTAIIPKGNEQIRVSPSADFPVQSRSSDILAVRGDFRCRAGCIFQREICAEGHAFVGAGTQLQAIASGGDLTIDKRVRIVRWADCSGEMTVGENSVVNSRATADRIICLYDGAQVKSASAPIVCSLPETFLRRNLMEEPSYRLEIPLSHSEPGMRRMASDLAIEPQRLTMLSPGCWQYDGDLKPATSLRVKTKLIVRGDFLIPLGSIIEEDVKAHGEIRVGENSVCFGNVIAEGSIRFGASSRFFGIVHSGKGLYMRAGVRGGDDEHRVVAFASEDVVIEDDVLVRGKLASGDRMVVVRASKSIGATPAVDLWHYQGNQW